MSDHLRRELFALEIVSKNSHVAPHTFEGVQKAIAAGSLASISGQVYDFNVDLRRLDEQIKMIESGLAGLTTERSIGLREGVLDLLGTIYDATKDNRVVAMTHRVADVADEDEDEDEDGDAGEAAAEEPDTSDESRYSSKLLPHEDGVIEVARGLVYRRCWFQVTFRGDLWAMSPARQLWEVRVEKENEDLLDKLALGFEEKTRGS